MPADQTPPHVTAESPEGAERHSFGDSGPLERLRERVERAASEIERLRQENANLATRVGDLATDDLFQEAEVTESPFAGLEGDPEALREKIQRFIEALDRVLAERASQRPSPPPDAAA